MKKIIILILVFLTTLFSQDIVNKLGGNDENATYDITNSDDVLLFRVDGGHRTSMGYNTAASGDYSTAMGLISTASGHGATAIGYDTNAIGNWSTAMGYGTQAKAFSSTVVGQYNDDETNAKFIVGNGTSDSIRRNAFVVFYSGDARIYDDLYIGTNIGTNDDDIRFDDGTEYIRWDESEDQFYISDQLKVSQSLIASDLWTLFGGGGTEYKLAPFGQSVIWGIGSFPSDKRLKENISTITSPLEKIHSLRGVNYNWNDKGKELFINEIRDNIRPDQGLPENEQEKIMQGIIDDKLAELSQTEMSFIAQEVEEVFPEWVVENDDGYKEINMKGLEGVLVEAIKELSNKVDEQNERIKELEKLIKEK